jgi:outer membrane protein
MFIRKQPLRHLLSCSALAALVLATPAAADTLREALVSSYRTNPTLNGQREALRVNDAGVAVARAAGRPQVAATVGVNRDLTRSGVLDTGRSKGPILSGGLDLSLPLFQGGRVRNSVEAARTRVEAGRATLRAVEGDVFVQAVQAYMDVIRDRAIVELNRNQVQVLTTNLQATQDRFQIGDLTRTDVAQSEARLSLARSSLALAEGRLLSSEAFYRQVVGQAPGQLASPPPLPPLPADADEAVRIALVENPDVIAVVRQAEAAGLDVRVANADRLPTVSGVVSGDYINTVTGSTGGIDRSGTQTSVGVNTRIPLYQGGLPSARIAQARAVEGQLLERTIETERFVVQAVRSAFASVVATRQAIASNEVAVSAAQLALEGARAERGVGTRTVLDVLNAEQELLNAQVQLVTARRDSYVAGFQLLNAMGQAEADDLGLDGGPLYDPVGAYRRVASQWNDWSSEGRYVPRSTRTVSPAEQPIAVQPAAPIAGPPATGVTTPPR